MNGPDEEWLTELQHTIREERVALEGILRRAAGALAPLPDTVAARLDRLEQAVAATAGESSGHAGRSQERSDTPSGAGPATWFGLAVDSGRRLRPELPAEEEKRLDQRVVRAMTVFRMGDNWINSGGGLCSDEDLSELTWGLAKGYASTHRTWREAPIPEIWRQRSREDPEHDWLARAPEIRPPWNAVVRYEPPGAGEALYFAARVGNPPKWDWEIRVSHDDLPAFIACLVIGTLQAVRAGALPAEAAQEVLRFESIGWLHGLIPDAVMEHIGRIDLRTEQRVDRGRHRPRGRRKVPPEELDAAAGQVIGRLEAELHRMVNPMWMMGAPSDEEFEAWEKVHSP